MDYLCELKDGNTSLSIVNITNSDIILKERQTVKRGDLVELQDTDELMISQRVVHYVWVWKGGPVYNQHGREQGRTVCDQGTQERNLWDVEQKVWMLCNEHQETEMHDSCGHGYTRETRVFSRGLTVGWPILTAHHGQSGNYFGKSPTSLRPINSWGTASRSTAVQWS